MYICDSTYVWHVSKRGDDDSPSSHDGHSFDGAYKTVNHAVDNSSSEDTIIIWPGDYDENVDFRTISKVLILGSNRIVLVGKKSISGERQIRYWQCPICKKKEEEVLPNDPLASDVVTKYICDVCKREFGTERGRNNHISRAHKE